MRMRSERARFWTNCDASLAQEVRSNLGRVCGVILYETKRTQNWSDAWTAKLKDDMRTVKVNHSDGPALTAAVCRALPQARFRPATLRGQAVRMVYQTEFRF